MRLALLALATLTMTACGAMQKTDSELTARGWAERGEKRQADPAAIWCYRTLGRPDCSTTPLPDQAYRLIEDGVQPPPAAPIENPAEDTLARRTKHFLGL